MQLSFNRQRQLTLSQTPEKHSPYRARESFCTSRDPRNVISARRRYLADGDRRGRGANAPRGHSITQLGRGVGRRGPPTHSCTYITGEHTDDETRSERTRCVRDTDGQPLYRVSRPETLVFSGHRNFFPRELSLMSFRPSRNQLCLH